MAKSQGEQILETLLAKGGTGSKNAEAVSKLQSELKAYQEARSSIAAAIKPSMSKTSSTVSESGVINQDAITTSKSVEANIKDIRADQKKDLEISKKSVGLIEKLTNSSLKYFENNNELINKLLVSNDLNNQRFTEVLSEFKGSFGKPSKNLGGMIGGVTRQDGVAGQTPGGGGFTENVLGTVGGAAAGAGAVKAFSGKKNNEEKNKKQQEQKKNKLKKAGGIIAAILGVAGAGAAIAFLSGKTEEERQQILDGVGLGNLGIPTDDEGIETMGQIGAATVATGIGVASLDYGAGKEKLAVDNLPKAKPPAISVADDAAEQKRMQSKAKPRIEPTFKGITATEDAAEKTKLKSISARRADSKIAKEAAEAALKQKVAKEIAEIGSKGSIKTVAKSIPVVGALTGAGFAAYRALTGDPNGAALELGTGIASMVPGVGTGLAIAGEITQLARDVYTAVHGTFPEDDAMQDPALFEERSKFIAAEVESYVKSLVGGGSTGGQATSSGKNIGNSRPSSINPRASGTGGTTFGSSEPQAALPGKFPITPSIKIPESTVSSINQPGLSSGGVNVVKGGDTINNVTNNNGNSGKTSGSPGVVSSTAPANPWDAPLYGDGFLLGN